jgi:hypothetical protein
MANVDAAGVLNSFKVTVDFYSASIDNWAGDMAIGVFNPVSQSEFPLNLM